MAAAGVGRWLRPGSVRGQLRLIVVAMVLAITVNAVAALLLGLALDRSVEVRRETDRVDRSVRALFDAVVAEGQGNALQQLRDRRADGADDPEEAAALERVDAALRAWHERSEVVVATAEDDIDAAREIAADQVGQRLFQDVRDAVQDFADLVAARSTASLEEARSDWRRYLALLVAALAGSVVLTVYTARRLTTQLTRPLSHLVSDASRVSGGELQHPVAAEGPTELAAVGQAVEAMRTRLLHERSQAARRSLLTGQEDERRRLAMGIHDDSVQAVLAASLRLQRLRRHLLGADPDGVELVQEVQTDLEEAISRLRRMIFELHPPTLDREGLEAAMRLYLSETLDPAGVSWDLEPEEVPADPVTDALVYRLFREAVLNVLRHADASSVRVTLAAADGDVRVEIEDDGVGFEPALHENPTPGHLGMLASRQLCEATGGRWEVDSAPGHGTRVRFQVPGSLG
jgi:signal transduction histidine kinase